MAMARRFRQVDVFSERALLGNPLAVVLDGDGLSSDEMQAFANWTNLSETVFVTTPERAEADYALRIFTPTFELPFAGHPTLGACFSWLDAGGSPRQPEEIVQECALGLVRISRRGDHLAFGAPEMVRFGDVDATTLQRAARVLGIELDAIVASHHVDNGPGWLGVMLADVSSVLDIAPGPLEGLLIGVIAPTRDDREADFEVRAFFPQGNLTVEDPVTGSLNASLAQWLTSTGRARAPYRVRQGTALGREGLISIQRDDTGQVWVGGRVTTVVEGVVHL